MIVNNIVEKDIHLISDLQPEKWPDITLDFKFYIGSPFCNPIKILVDEKIVGVGCGISFGKTAWLAHIIVDEKHRAKGIGTFIVNYLCNYLKSKDASTISLIATESGFKVYQKVGFSFETEYVFLGKDEKVDHKISNNIRKLEKHDHREVLSLDKRISGEDRSILLRGNLADSYVYYKQGKIMGYYLPDLGEGLIMAQDMEDGIELMKLRSKHQDRFVLPINNIPAVEFLLNNGFSEVDRAQRMVYGEGFSWNPSKLFNRIGGNFG